METVRDSLPGQPLDASDIEAINEAASLTLVPYSWRGDQVITLLVDTDGQITGGRFEPPTGSRQNVIGSPKETGDDDAGVRSDGRSIGFDTGDTGPIGTVEVIETESFVPEDVEFRRTGTAESDKPSGDTPETSNESAAGAPIPAIGYDPDGTAWVLIDELDAGTSLEDAEPVIREWLTNTYQEQMVDHFDVGPSEYELPG